MPPPPRCPYEALAAVPASRPQLWTRSLDCGPFRALVQGTALQRPITAANAAETHTLAMIEQTLFCSLDVWGPRTCAVLTPAPHAEDGPSTVGRSAHRPPAARKGRRITNAWGPGPKCSPAARIAMGIALGGHGD